MGHDLRIHEKYYRQPERVLQVTKVVKVLLGLNNGSLKNCAGKSLDQIEERDLNNSQGEVYILS